MQQNIYWYTLDIQFKDKISVKYFDDSLEGFIQGALLNLGVTAESEEYSEQLIFNYLKTDKNLRNYKFKVCVDSVGEIDFNDVDKEIYDDEDIADAIIQSPYDKGIWYVSGKFLYHNDKNDDSLYEVKFE